MNLGMPELLVIGIVALIVIGPKDLPEMFRQLGRMTAKMRAMGREFSRAMEQAANEAGVSDIAKDLKSATDPKSMGLNAMKDAVDKFEKWDPIKNAAKPTQPLKPGGVLTPPPMPATPAPAPAAASPAPAPAAALAETPAAPAAAMGPNTKALYEKKAAKEAVLKETAEKLRAIDKPEAVLAETAATDKAAAAKPVKTKAAAKPASGEIAAKSPRKKKAAQA